MKNATRERLSGLIETNGWSLDRARGYVDGEAYRLRGRAPSKYCLVGIDEYCLGFRAGYFERQDLDLDPDIPGAAVPTQ